LTPLNPKVERCHLFFDKGEAELKGGLGTGPFREVPFALKDIRQYLERSKQAGLLIFFGKMNAELGLTTTTESVLFGETHNP